MGEIKACRVCRGRKFKTICNLGEQFLTGVFPKPGKRVAKSPLVLIQCKKCNLVQLKHTYNLKEMYGLNYGYRSSLNGSMVSHLKDVYKGIVEAVSLNPGDVVIDIGSNDGTFLKQYPEKCYRIGVDPTIEKFSKYYIDTGIVTFTEFFPTQNLTNFLDGKKAKVITSIACFYDLERPLDFMRGIYNLLEEDGIWVFEQSYMPDMIRTLSYDMVCHEHLEYYHYKIIEDMCRRTGLKVVNVWFNETNGGSFCVSVAKEESKRYEWVDASELIEQEELLFKEDYFLNFQSRIDSHKKELLEAIEICKKTGLRVGGWGASTKGNVLLQYCNIDNKVLSCIAEINEDKYGCVTPGTNIPILPEREAKTLCDVFLALPWHFKNGILKKNPKTSFIFPLPNCVEVCLSIDAEEYNK